ncbi:MAG: hypothetical protein HYS07_04170 [Chlamydiae bacterium]|nr:hypothetical protein [Chlamydiota bacterium]MBI3277395.1 hypothetical protein [Chlamydiota bacterium]
MADKGPTALVDVSFPYEATDFKKYVLSFPLRGPCLQANLPQALALEFTRQFRFQG